jgi:hypothetical protein
MPCSTTSPHPGPGNVAAHAAKATGSAQRPRSPSQGPGPPCRCPVTAPPPPSRSPNRSACGTACGAPTPPGSSSCATGRTTKKSTAGGYDIALVTTDLTATPQEIIARYAARWSIEVTFFDVKNILGVGQARNRTTKAVQRTVPFGLFCHSILIVWYALHGHDHDDPIMCRWFWRRRAASTPLSVGVQRSPLPELDPRENGQRLDPHPDHHRGRPQLWTTRST